MPRIARIVAPGEAHHVTQRGTNRQTVFFSRRDRQVYLQLLQENSLHEGLRILAYCLMANHIHLVVVLREEESLAVTLRRTHGRYAQYLNARRRRSGHLWQNRFYSCPLEERHLWTALRYVERNPVRAGLVEEAQNHAWSSAQSHLSGIDRLRLLDLDFWREAGGAERWSALLAGVEEELELRRLRSATYAGRPFGTKKFAEPIRREVMEAGRQSGEANESAAIAGEGLERASAGA